MSQFMALLGPRAMSDLSLQSGPEATTDQAVFTCLFMSSVLEPTSNAWRKWQRTRAAAPSADAHSNFAASPDGCTAAILMAHGIRSDPFVELISAGQASVTTEPVMAGDRETEDTRVRITDAGRQALTSEPT
jgi:hypothetical protein